MGTESLWTAVLPNHIFVCSSRSPGLPKRQPRQGSLSLWSPEDTEAQTEIVTTTQGPQEGRPGRAACRKRKGHGDLVFTARWGPGGGAEGPCREGRMGGRLLKTDRKEASSWQ